MIRVLVMATDSLLADYVVTALSKEPGIEVLRVARDELGSRKDYSAVIVMDDEMDETESIKLKEFVQKDKSLLLMRLSSGNKVISVDETYRLINPGIEQIVDLLEEFDRKTLTTNADDTSPSQKKMNDVVHAQTAEYNGQSISSSFGRYFAVSQVLDFQQHLAGNAGASAHGEIPMFFFSFFLHYLRLKNPKNVTLPIWQDYATGTNRR